MTHYTKTTSRRRPSRYPNAATARYYIELWQDRILTAAAVIGLIVVLFFLATM